MSDHEPEADPATPPDGGSPAAGGPPRRPGHRRNPAAMRETLDAARRRLGPANPSDVPQSAARQRALLREAVANQTVPLGSETGASGPSPSRPASGDGPDGDPDPDAPA